MIHPAPLHADAGPEPQEFSWRPPPPRREQQSLTGAESSLGSAEMWHCTQTQEGIQTEYLEASPPPSSDFIVRDCIFYSSS